jgi:hypothetical protein
MESVGDVHTIGLAQTTLLQAQLRDDALFALMVARGYVPRAWREIPRS